MKKQFVVIGLGRFGSSLAKTLYSLGHEVLAVDENEEAVQGIVEHVTHAVQADATDESSLNALGIRNFDVAVIAIGNDMQASILVTLMVKELGLKYVVSKAMNDLHAKVLYKTGADRVVFPEREMGVKIANNLISSNILDYIELSEDYSVVETQTLPKWIGKNLLEINMRAKFGVNVMAIKRNSKINISPNADDILEEGDTLIVVGNNEDLSRLSER
ncbi:MAG: TrkA family potassium uptake protein [Peptostreptococcaceae bacterium]|nr:TrkA family potassium uptake protein [Peptostreptococcaceae bacterium]